MRIVERDIDDLPKNPANYTALTPLGFLERAALVHPTRKSVIHGSLTYTWQDTYRRCRRLASALAKRAVTFGSTVAVIAPNIPAMYEAHFGVPMSGAVLNAVNIRLNAQTIAFLLGHSKSSVIMVDQEFFTLAEEAVKILAEKSKGNFMSPLFIVIADENCDPKTLQYALRRGAIEYEKFLETGDPDFAWKPPEDEWHSIALGYTSGTTASPKGVVLHHRGAYLMALSNAIIWGMQEGAVYLWTLPLFHCNGWCFAWTLAAICGTSVCLRQVTAKAIYSAIDNLGVTHFCAAPVVLNSIANARNEEIVLPLRRTVNVMTAGAAPPPSLLFAMSQRGFRVAHTYGLS
ncbi:Acetate/butyrate--CoA ligase AAE7 [Abeliophyllum distichum]|uniref:Acetate/butyrate--CoA ligase AAE7 n=1 Tax=Abeliophyllum distichum TaxID=126358 RepID=A0ABD1VCU8_9LAMI